METPAAVVDKVVTHTGTAKVSSKATLFSLVFCNTESQHNLIREWLNQLGINEIVITGDPEEFLSQLTGHLSRWPGPVLALIDNGSTEWRRATTARLATSCDETPGPIALGRFAATRFEGPGMLLCDKSDWFDERMLQRCRVVINELLVKWAVFVNRKLQ